MYLECLICSVSCLLYLLLCISCINAVNDVPKSEITLQTLILHLFAVGMSIVESVI